MRLYHQRSLLLFLAVVVVKPVGWPVHLLLIDATAIAMLLENSWQSLFHLISCRVVPFMLCIWSVGRSPATCHSIKKAKTIPPADIDILPICIVYLFQVYVTLKVTQIEVSVAKMLLNIFMP